MEYDKRLISTSELVIGMYVSELDIPWGDTPFPLQGFCIKTEKEIQLLRELCDSVYVDRRFYRPHKAESRSTGSLPLANGDTSLNEKLPVPKPVVNYSETTTVEEELKEAKKNHDDLSGRFKILFAPFKPAEKINYEELKEPISQMVDSVIRNPNAYLRLILLKKIDDYTYNHCINMSILSVMFGRHLGLSEDDLNILAWGTMFCDYGKVMVPPDLLKKVGRLSKAEFKLVKRHVIFSMDAVKKIDGFSSKASEIIQYHHERFNGTGYPDGMKGKDIPMFSRLASIVDTYDALINDRPYAKAISPHEALRELYDLRNIAFQPELVEAFIQAIGVYPIGTLVELNTGEVGIVISQNKIRHLKPQIMLLLDSEKIAHKIAPIMNLLDDPVDQNGKNIVITDVLEPGSYGIKPEDYYNF